MGEIALYRQHADKIARLMASMQKEPDQVELDAQHLFCPGVYMRVLHMPAGSTVVSKIHKTEHFAIALTGKAQVVYADEKVIVEAPHIMVTKPGTQRALYILEDATWLTIHPTEETDVDTIEQNIIAKDFNDPDLLEYFGEETGLITHEE